MKKIKENNGTAIILMLVIVSVLFIFTSFLVRKVIINTTMVEKSGQEQESYAIAKQGILYALDKLNAWEGTAPDYDSTAWLDGENWDAGNWNSYDLNGESEVEIRIDKDDIPHPEDSDPAFDSTDDDDGDEPYITIESRDSARKLVTLQAIAKNNSPLLDYVRFINSDTTFQDNTFDETGEGSLIEGEAPLCILGNVAWESGSKNDIQLEETTSKALIYGTISNDGVDELKISGDKSKQGYYYFFDPDNASYDDPDLFDTAEGHYFSSAHLPSCYDYSETPSPAYYYGGPQNISWPEIKEYRFWDSETGATRLADIVISSDNCGKRAIRNDFVPYYWWDDWYPSDNTHLYSYSDIDGSTVANVYWRREGSTASYNYTPPGVHLIFSDTQDLNPSTSGTMERLIRIDDDDTTDLPAEYETSASVSYSLFTSEDVIFCEKDVRVNGVLPRDLAIVSKGNIYVDSNIYTNGHSLALLAKENVLLNTTHRWIAGYEGDDNWKDNDTSAANLIGVSDVGVARAEVSKEGGDSIKFQILNFGGGTTAQMVTADNIVLRGCAYSVSKDNTLDFAAEVDLGGENWRPLTIAAGPTFPINGLASDSYLTIVLEMPTDFRSFSRLRLTATGGGTGDDPAGWIEVNAVEVPIADMDEIAVFAENGSWYVISGNGASVNNDQQEPFTLNVAISEQNFEDMSKWDGTNPLEATWNDITYTYDSSLKSNPPPSLPPSVSLVSLKRK